MGREHLRVDVGAQLAVSLFREADEWAGKGDLGNEQKALDAARSQLAQSGMDSREAAEAKAEERVPFTRAEETQANADQAEAVKQAVVVEAARVERAALVGRLTAGDASPEEVQQALATLIGG